MRCARRWASTVRHWPRCGLPYANNVPPAPRWPPRRGDHTRAAEHAAELADRSRAAAREAVRAGERHGTLQATVGAAVAELQRRLADVAAALRDCDEDERATRREQNAATGRQAAADVLRTRVRTEIEDTVRTRADAIDALRRFAATGLLAVALPDLDHPGESWAPEPAVRLARAVERELESVDDSDAAWERVQRRITEELKDLSDALSRHGHTAAARMLEDGLVVDIVFQGRERSVPDLADALATEVADRQRLLSAREQEILENHLITEVAGTLQELVGAAEHQVLRHESRAAGPSDQHRHAAPPGLAPGTQRPGRAVHRPRPAAAPVLRRLDSRRPCRPRRVPPGPDRPRPHRRPGGHLARAPHHRVGLPLLARVRHRTPPARQVAVRHRPRVRRRACPVRLPSAVRRRLLALRLGRQPRTPPAW